MKLPLPLFPFGAVGGSELLSSDGSDGSSGAELPFVVVVVVVVVIVANGPAEAVRGGTPSSSSGCNSAATQCVQTASSTLHIEEEKIISFPLCSFHGFHAYRCADHDELLLSFSIFKRSTAEFTCVAKFK